MYRILRYGVYLRPREFHGEIDHPQSTRRQSRNRPRICAHCMDGSRFADRGDSLRGGFARHGLLCLHDGAALTRAATISPALHRRGLGICGPSANPCLPKERPPAKPTPTSVGG